MAYLLNCIAWLAFRHNIKFCVRGCLNWVTCCCWPNGHYHPCVCSQAPTRPWVIDVSTQPNTGKEKQIPLKVPTRWLVDFSYSSLHVVVAHNITPLWSVLKSPWHFLKTSMVFLHGIVLKWGRVLCLICSALSSLTLLLFFTIRGGLLLSLLSMLLKHNEHECKNKLLIVSNNKIFYGETSFHLSYD